MKMQNRFVVYCKCTKCRKWESISTLDGEDVSKLPGMTCQICNAYVNWYATPPNQVPQP
jgi:hypothetical protein